MPKSLIDEIFEESKTDDNNSKYASYGLLRNPFPGNEEEFFGFVNNQVVAKDTFRKSLAEFTSSRTVSAVHVVADHRIGKTNFLRHYHQRLLDSFETEGKASRQGRYLPFYTKVYEYDFMFLYRDIIDRIPSELLIQLFHSLIEDPLSIQRPETDLDRAFTKICVKNTDGDDLERATELFKLWLRGGYRSLTKDQRATLGVNDNVTNAPVGTRFLKDLLRLMNERRILTGIICIWDEFERLVGAGISRGQKDRYLNDIRNFLSDMQTGVFFCFAITPGSLQELQRVYPAIPPRLGTRLTLSSLRTESEAIQFAREYITWFRNEAKPNLGNMLPDELLTDDQISLVFFRVSKRYAGGVPQGMFLSSLRDEVEQLFT